MTGCSTTVTPFTAVCLRPSPPGRTGHAEARGSYGRPGCGRQPWASAAGPGRRGPLDANTAGARGRCWKGCGPWQHHPPPSSAPASRKVRAATVRLVQFRRRQEAIMILDRFKVTDQVAIVTGSGRGIGAASAVALAEAGADIVLAARTEEQLSEGARRVEGTGRRAAFVAGDLTDVGLMGSLAYTAHRAFGRVDMVVNNLGGPMPRPLLDTSPRALEEAFHFNVGAGHALVRAAVPLMLEGDDPGGAIVNISSVMGHAG